MAKKKKEEPQIEETAEESAEESTKSINNLNKILDDKAKTQGIVFQAMQKENRIRGALSTGVRSFDLICGGGFAPGSFNNIIGPSGSCKSTLLGKTTKEAIRRNIIVDFHDHECSVDPVYWEKMGINLQEVCGFRNKKGEWEIEPKLRYSIGTTAEDTFKFMTVVMRAMPDKIFFEDNYYLIDPEYEYQRTWPSIKKGIEKGLVMQVEDNAPQMLFLVDSIRAMLPDARDGEDKNVDKEPTALLARTLGLCFPLIKTLLGRKNCVFVCTNQLTINPMCKFGNPETEPGGSAMEFYPDFKLRLFISRGKDSMEEEPHFSGDGIDRYWSGTANIKKNKFGPATRKASYRLWADEKGDAGRGIDPVFDLFNFYDMLGKVEQSRVPKTKELQLRFLLDDFQDKTYTWTEFKRAVLTDDEAGVVLGARADEMLRDGTAQSLYYDAVKNDSRKETKDNNIKKKSDDKAVEV
jgi:RecA/RadA recombinase